jgi:glycosyltransferase involved in cell wall biosynthesis
MDEPLVSVVTPFHNTAAYLGQCIESVLAQTYARFEYILVDNKSTDGSSEIAAAYAKRDPRIRLIRRSCLLSQVRNYNTALMEISADSRYCKMVQADDYIFPECLQSMVQAFEQSESIGLVSSYWLKGNQLRGSGFPAQATRLPGGEVGRLYLRDAVYVFGSPTAVMYRSALVRQDQPFFDESLLHEDTEKCMQLLREWDFGFVHQVLSFSRADNESISFAVRAFQPVALDRYILVRRYAAAFLKPEEAAKLSREARRRYYGILAMEALSFPGATFWQYHKSGLESLGDRLDRPYLALKVVWKLLGLVANPGATLGRVYRYSKRRIMQEERPEVHSSLETRPTH